MSMAARPVGGSSAIILIGTWIPHAGNTQWEPQTAPRRTLRRGVCSDLTQRIKFSAEMCVLWVCVRDSLRLLAMSVLGWVVFGRYATDLKPRYATLSQARLVSCSTRPQPSPAHPTSSPTSLTCRAYDMEATLLFPSFQLFGKYQHIQLFTVLHHLRLPTL